MYGSSLTARQCELQTDTITLDLLQISLTEADANLYATFENKQIKIAASIYFWHLTETNRFCNEP